MSGAFEAFFNFIKYLAQILPLEAFVFLGSFIEELVGPIPSPLIMTTAGTLAAAKRFGFIYLILLALLGATGKVLVSLVLYYLGDKAEDVIVHKYGKYLGITEGSIEKLRTYFSRDLKDDIILFLLRAIPIFPTGTVSIVCGVLQLDLRTFIISSTLGFIVRGLIYLIIGYYGLESLREGLSFISGSELLTLLAAIVVFSVVFVLYRNERFRTYFRSLHERKK